jgi:hypothetical protein
MLRLVINAFDVFGVGGKFQEIAFVHGRQRHIVGVNNPAGSF